VDLEDAISARYELNGQEINGSIVKIGFAKVPSKAEPLSAQQALGNPSILTGLATAAMDRLYASGVLNDNDFDKEGDTYFI
jgi:hypothetical protein